MTNVTNKNRISFKIIVLLIFSSNLLFSLTIEELDATIEIVGEKCKKTNDMICKSDLKALEMLKNSSYFKGQSKKSVRVTKEYIKMKRKYENLKIKETTYKKQLKAYHNANELEKLKKEK